jgi:anti-sigma B factor antagonist
MNNFSINSRTEHDIYVLELNGELDAHTAPVLEDNITSLIEQAQFRIIVNCSGLDYISSAGLGVFMAYIEDVRNLGGDIKLTNMKPSVYNVFDLLGFPTLYDILDEEKEAIAKFTSPND